LVMFVFRRLGLAAVVVWLAVSAVFALFFVVPGDRVGQIVGGDRVLSSEERLQVEQRLGLNDPLFDQYARYLVSASQGDFGQSYVTSEPVVELVERTIGPSLRLAFWALIVELVVGVGTALWIYGRRSRSARALSLVATTSLVATPIFVLAVLLQVTLGVVPFLNGWPDWMTLPVQGIGPDEWVLGVFPAGEQWRYLLLPAVTLGLVSGAIAHRLTAEAFKTALTAAPVEGARLRGVRQRHVLWRHAARPALVPVLTFVGVDLAALFGSAVVTEQVFNWPGLGNEMASALGRADVPVIMGLTVLLAIAYTAVNLCVDIAHRVADPRVGIESQ
jgi:oligopeptide transport system permease protein